MQAKQGDFKLKYLCCVRLAKAQKASDRADAEDGPGGTRRKGAGETEQGLPHLGLSILPEPRGSFGRTRPQQNSWHPTGDQQAGG